MISLFKAVQKYIYSRKYILIFSLVYFAARLIYLNSYFLLRDERDLILTALSLAQTGKDLYGNSYPLIFSHISPQAPLLGMYWVVPIISLFHITSVFLVKIMYLLPTLFFPSLIFELIKLITKDYKVSFLTAFVVSFSPWYFHISRLGIEAHLAYFFCLLGLIMYLRGKKYLGVILLTLSYFSYFGIRPFILISIPYIEFWNYLRDSKKNWKIVLLSLSLFIVFFSGIFLLGSQFEQTGARSSSEVIFLNKEKLTLETNFLRSISNAPFIMREFFDNKISIISYTVGNNFFKGIDFSYLFFSGDYVGMYTNRITGQFFPFLFVFIILGICSLAKKNKPEYYFMAGFSFVGLISSLINSYSLTFSIRSSTSLIGIGFVCTLGIMYAYELMTNKRLRALFIIFVMFLYSLYTVNFAYKYLFQNYNITNSIFNEHERYVAQYSGVHTIKTIMVPNIHSYFLSLVSTLPLLSSDLFEKVQIELNNKNQYQLSGHRFLQCTSGQINPASINSIASSTIIEESCLSTKTKLYISQHKSSKIIELLDPEYKNNDINRSVKYYFFSK